MLFRLDDASNLPITLPNPNATMLVRPLAVPLALLALGIGFVLWKFMGDLPGALKIGLSVILEALLIRRKPAQRVAAVAPLVLPREAGLDALKIRDSSFQETAMLQQGSRVAQALAASWLQGDLTACRDFLSADCWQNQQDQLMRGTAQGWRRSPAGISASAQQILAARIEASSESVTIRIGMSPSSAGTRAVRGRRVAEWIEDWSFRRSVSTSATSPGRMSFGPWQVDRMDHVEVHFERAA